MKLHILLCGVLLGMCLVMAVVLGLIDEPDPSHGFAHPTFESSMQQGGSGVQRHEVVRWWGLAYGTFQIIFFVASLVMGVRASAKSKSSSGQSDT